MTSVRHLFASAVLFASLACGPPDLTELVGCYDVEMGPWSPPVDSGDSIYVAPPTRVVLDTPASSRGGGRRVARTAPGAAPSIGTGWWEEAGPDSFVVAWMSHSGVVMQLPRAGVRRAGRARALWDYKSVEETASVVATPVACDAPLPEGAAADHRYPDGIVTAQGDSIRLGDPLPGDWSVPESGPDRVGTPALRPPFTGGERVELYGSTERGIHQIRVVYPASVDRAALVAALRDALGEPTSIREAGPGRSEALPGWYDRFVSVSFWETGRPGEEGFFLMITDR